MLVDQGALPIWQPVMTKNIWISLAMKELTFFAHEIKYMCMNTSPNVLERLKLLRFIGMENFSTK